MAYNFEPLGPAPIKEPFMARLNRSNPWGSGNAAGAINTLEMVQDPVSKNGILYAGSVSGGVWSRKYDADCDTWGTWTWLSGSNGFGGAQSISQVNVLDDQRWLIAAAGDSSSFRETLIKPRSSLQGDLSLTHETAARHDFASLPL